MFHEVLTKSQNLFFKMHLFYYRHLGLPAQIGRERSMYLDIFRSFKGRSLKIFEWGSGYSTVYYSKWLRDHGFDFQWQALDNNVGWVDCVRKMISKEQLADRAKVNLKEFVPFWEKPNWDWKKLPPAPGAFSPQTQVEQDYINFPISLGEKFDIIFIDARFRRRCLKTALMAIKDDGVVVMHDAQKAHYHQGTEEFALNKFYTTGSWYPFQDKLNQVWVGAKENKTIFDLLRQYESS
jgi:hypothetical protein